MWLRGIFRRRTRPAVVEARTALDEQLLRRLERLALAASRGLRGGLSGAHPSRRRLPAPTFTDHRPYSTGDDLRYVDWNAYARLDDLHLKLGEAEQDVRVTLLVDCSTSMDWGTGDSNKLHYARLLAAAIGYIALASGDRVQVIGFGGGTQATSAPWGPGSGRQRAASLLRYLDGLQATGTTTAGERLQELARTERGGLLVVLSDLWHNASLFEGQNAALNYFQLPRWQVLLLHLLHAEELQPPAMGDVELIDSETGARLALQTGRDGVDEYIAAVERWCRQIHDACRRRDGAYARITTGTPLERAVLPYLEAREVLR